MHKITLRTPEDITTAIPVVLGFHPRESLVMMTFGPKPFHARIDLPEFNEVDAAIHALLAPCLMHGVQGVLLVAYSDFPREEFLFEIGAAMTGAGIEVHDSLRVDDTTIYRAENPIGVHVAQAADNMGERMDKPINDSREEYARRMAVRDDALLVDELLAFRPEVTRLMGHWIHETVAKCDFLLTHDLVDLVSAIGHDKRLRDCAWSAMNRQNARAQVTFWRDVVTRVEPSAFRDTALNLYAFAAWLNGNGALCWTALDAVETPDTLTKLITAALQQASNPAEWSAADDLFERALLAI